jgi:hypothetical protein
MIRAQHKAIVTAVAWLSRSARSVRGMAEKPIDGAGDLTDPALIRKGPPQSRE